jgi:hypothetical protein
MPEPIYNWRLADGTLGVAATGAPVAPQRRAAQGPTVAIDIAPQDHLGRQISSERHAHAEDDLLTADAPKE